MLKVLSVIGLIISALFLLGGVSGMVRNSGVAESPVKMDLAELEKTLVPLNRHVEFGQHLAYYEVMAYEYREGGAQGAYSGKLSHVNYPIYSMDHPFTQEYIRLNTLWEAGEIGDDEFDSLIVKAHREHPARVLVKSTEFSNFNALPDISSVAPNFRGVAHSDTGTLDAEFRPFLAPSLSGTNFDQTLLIEMGPPRDGEVAMAMLVIGLIGLLASAALWKIRSRRAKAQAALAAEWGSQGQVPIAGLYPQAPSRSGSPFSPPSNDRLPPPPPPSARL